MEKFLWFGRLTQVNQIREIQPDGWKPKLFLTQPSDRAPYNGP